MAEQRETLLLANNVSATGAQPAAVAYGGSDYIFSVLGTFGGTSVQLQVLGPNGSTWMNVGPAMVEAGMILVSVGPNASMRVNLTGGTPSGIFATLETA